MRFRSVRTRFAIRRTTDAAAPDPAEAIRPTQPDTQDSRSTPQPLDKRAFGVLPNYDTANETGVYNPITSGQKLHIAVIDSIDYPVLLTGAGYAGLAQLTNQHSNFGQGMKGYSLRYITSFTDQRLYVALATDAFGQILREFWPDFKQKFFSHRPKNTP